MTRTKSIYLALLTVLISPMAANAGLVGTEVGCSITPTPFWVCDQPSNTVGAGLEFLLDLPSNSDSFGFSIDVSDTSIRISNIEDNGFVLAANELLTLEFFGDVLGVSNFTASNVSVVSLASISLLGNALSIDLDSRSLWQVGSFVSFDIAVATVPEPGTLSLLGLALLGTGLARRRKQV